MSPDRERRLEEVFSAARDLPALERAAFLERACEGDAELRSQADSLLAAHEQAGDFLDHTIPLPAPDFLIERTGTMIGRYKLLEKIGEGGFGVVYMAEQVEPLQRKVALKIIKAGMDTKEVIARFEAERQALALMDHPNIAKVLDAGATEAGRPYFVMELVRGISITDYCDQKALSTAERLQLFIQVCHAVQHAHQKGIIHRDLKPSNVMVTLRDGEPVPKVIDFGVAKALGQKLTEKTLFTGFAQMLGTPAYMSPEQAELSGLDVDTRSDVYSLGVLLYELLTGFTPFDKETLAKVALDEIRRIIRETEPPKPSTRLQTLGDRLGEVAKHRHAEPAALSRLVRGDLDWIVMKCLEKDRARRYETASTLARDLEFHLKHQPVLAAAPTVGYRLSKFARRHQAIMLRSAVAFLIGVVAVTGGLWIVNGRGPRWLPEIRPRPRAVNTPPHVDFERGISDVYVQDFSVSGPGVRMLGSDEHLFVRTKAGAGGWRVFNLERQELAPAHPHTVAYVVRPDRKTVFELAVETNGITCGRFLSGRSSAVSPAPATNRDLQRLIALPTTVDRLIICALPEVGILFAFDAETGKLAWTNCVAAHMDGPDMRIGHLAADEQVVVAGLWGSRLWAVDARTGEHRWFRDTHGHGNSILPFVFGERVFAFGANESAFAFDKTTGRQQWERRVGLCNSGDDVVVHGTNLIVKLQVDVASSGSLVMAISQSDGGEQWQVPLLTNHSGGALASSGDLLVAAVGRVLQRIDPNSGKAGAFIELPTLKKTVTLYGRDASVFVSHPLVLRPPDTVYAFTVDGSLWGVHLPEISTRLTLPSTEITRRSPVATPEQLATTNRPTPQLPAELTAWREQLQREGRGNLWTQLETTIDLKWEEAQGYARAFVGIPHVVIGRVVVPNSEDPRFVLAQMQILDGGYFASAVKDLAQPLSFRLPGCLPVDFPLKGKTGDLAFLGDILIPAASPSQLGAIRGKIRLVGVAYVGQARVSASIEMGEINHLSNGSEPRRFYPDPIEAQLDSNGQFFISGLSPAKHWVRVVAPGCLSIGRSVLVAPGQTNDLGVLGLERALPVQLSWFVADKPEFAGAMRCTGTVRADEKIQFSTRMFANDLRIDQASGRLTLHSFYASSRITDLGAQALVPGNRLDVGSLSLVHPDHQVQAGHVYLFRQEREAQVNWVLFRVDAIGDRRAQEPARTPTDTSPVSGQADPLFTNVVNAIEQLRGRLKKQTVSLDNLYAVLEPHLQELEELNADQLKQQQEAALAVQRAIPPRDPRTGVRLVNLSSNYNAAFPRNWHGDEDGNNLAELPTGVRRFDGVDFDVRGILQAPPAGPETPLAALTNIIVQQTCRRLHFLHAAINAGGLTNLTEVGRYIVHFAQGSDLIIPLRAGIELADWWHTPGDSAPLAPEAWKGTNGKTRKNEGCHIRLFHLAWDNPRPGAAVCAIDLVTTHEQARPFLVGLTLE